MSECVLMSRLGSADLSLTVPYPSIDFLQALENITTTRLAYGTYYFPDRYGDAVFALCLKWFPIVRDRRARQPARELVTETKASGLNLISDALLLLPVLRQAAQAFANTHRDGMFKTLDRVLSDDGDITADMLAMLGFMRVAAGPYDPPGATQRWVILPQHRTFWAYWRPRVLALITGEIATIDGEDLFLEQLSLPQLEALWTTLREEAYGRTAPYKGERFYPTRDTLGLWVAAVVASVPGADFVQSDTDALVLTRTLKPWLLQYPAEPIDIEVKEKNQHISHWAATRPEQTGERHGSLMSIGAIGNITALRALHAYLLDGKLNKITLRVEQGFDRNAFAAQRENGSGRYATTLNEKPLPESGYAHIDITHVSAFVPLPDESFIHLVGNRPNAGPDLALLFRQLDTALSIALRMEWTPLLWEYGLRQEQIAGRHAKTTPALIEPLASYNCTGWLIHVDEIRWTKIVQAIVLGIDPKSLTDSMAQVEIVKDAVITGAAADVVLEDEGLTLEDATY